MKRGTPSHPKHSMAGPKTTRRFSDACSIDRIQNRLSNSGAAWATREGDDTPTKAAQKLKGRPKQGHRTESHTPSPELLPALHCW